MRKGDLVRNRLTGEIGIMVTDIRNMKGVHELDTVFPPEVRHLISEFKVTLNVVDDVFICNVLTEGAIKEWTEGNIELVNKMIV